MPSLPMGRSAQGGSGHRRWTRRSHRRGLVIVKGVRRKPPFAMVHWCRVPPGQSYTTKGEVQSVIVLNRGKTM